MSRRIRVGLTMFLLGGIAISPRADTAVAPGGIAAALDQTLMMHLSGLDFSEAHETIVSGLYDVFPDETVVMILYGLENGLTNLEKDLLVYQVVTRALRRTGTGTEDNGRPVIQELVGRFASLTEHSLRALVLSTADELGVEGAEGAVMESADNLSRLLGGESDRRAIHGYEVEAMALATIAPNYASDALAELMRTLGILSRDRRVIEAARQSTLTILRSLSAP